MKIRQLLGITLVYFITNNNYVQASEVINIPVNHNKSQDTYNTTLYDNNKSLSNTFIDQLTQAQQVQNDFLIKTGNYCKLFNTFINQYNQSQQIQNDSLIQTWEYGKYLCTLELPPRTEEQKFSDYINDTMS